MITRRFFSVVLPLIVSVACVLSCSKDIDTFPTLSNQGLLPLSTNNPYFGANLFIAREAERSSFLYNFLQGQGAPMAVEIIEGQFEPARILMYYPRNREVYAADLQSEGEHRQWVVRGPFAIERADFKQLLKLETTLIGEPVFVIWGKEKRFRFEAAEPQRVIVPVIAPTPTPKPRTKTAVITHAPSVAGASPTTTPFNPKLFRPLNTDQQALMMAQGYAERTDNGDVIHSVGSDSETLEAIAEWYTKKKETAAEIGELNGIPAGKPLTSGQRIRIPLAKVVNFKRMGHS